LWAEIDLGVDYLATPMRADVAFTNPPFSLALPFLVKMLVECDTVIALLRINFLGSQQRKTFWQAHPPSHLFPLAKRPSFTGKGTDSTEYAWFVWQNNPKNGVISVGPGIYVI